MTGAVDVDDFIPWARHPDDAIHNVVLAHRTCNNRKREFLAAAPHVHHWSERFDSALDAQLRQLAAFRWGWLCTPRSGITTMQTARRPEGGA